MDAPKALATPLLTTALFLTGSLVNNGSSRTREVPGMDCRLVVENKSHSSPEEFVGTFELRNISLAPISMEYKNHRLFENLDLDLTDDKGILLPKVMARYSYLFGPTEAQIRTFGAGEIDSGQVMLFA